MDKIKDIFNMVVDSPNMVNNKLPWNSWNSCMDDSEGNLAKWTGDFFRVGAFVMLAASLYAIVMGIVTDGMGEGMAVATTLVSTLLWVYAAFPIAQVVRSAGEGLADSKSDTVTFIFHDLIMAIIKVFGTVTALIALFGAIAMSFTWLTTIDVNTAYDAGMMPWMDWGYNTVASATEAFMAMFGLEYVGGIITGFYNWTEGGAVTSAESFTWAGLVMTGWNYVGVAVILAQMYVTLALYKFYWTILNTLFNFIKNPYLPFKSK
jgi:hypothetical protein